MYPSFVTVLGSVNIDISGTSSSQLVLKDSNPGEIRFSHGGVGRNIAAGLARLGVKVELLTAFGCDEAARAIRQECRQLGVGLGHALSAEDQPTSAYLCINDEKGDMQIAVNDMSIYDLLTPGYLSAKLEVINQGELLVIDANLPSQSIEYLADHVKVPILAEPVSSIKGMKLMPVLSRLFMIKPNRLEAEVFSGIQIRSETDLERAADVLLSLGVKHVAISLGGEGVYYAGSSFRSRFPAYPCRLVNTTGCGDAFMAGFTWGVFRKIDMDAALRAGLAAASICIESTEPVSPDMTPGQVSRIACISS
jgi:pseudouridine kinase